MKKIIILFFVICCSFHHAQSQDDGYTDSTQVTADNMDEEEEDVQENSWDDADKKDFDHPTLRIVSSDTIARLSRDKEFAYMRYIDSFYRNTTTDNPIENNEEFKPSSSIFDITGIRVLYWSLALLAVLFILYKLFMGDTAVFAKNRRINPGPVQEEEIPMTNDHLSVMIQKAIKEKDFRNAIRLMYMQVLAKLGDKQLLVLAPQKTNYQYVQELSGKSLQPLFSRLTMHYEYAWFGNFPVNEQQFESIQRSYNDFKNLL